MGFALTVMTGWIELHFQSLDCAEQKYYVTEQTELHFAGPAMAGQIENSFVE